MLQDSPMYSYIPAKDLARARQFYEGKLGLKPSQQQNGGVVYEFGRGTAAFLARPAVQRGLNIPARPAA